MSIKAEDYMDHQAAAVGLGWGVAAWDFAGPFIVKLAFAVLASVISSLVVRRITPMLKG